MNIQSFFLRIIYVLNVFKCCWFLSGGLFDKIMYIFVCKK